MFFFFFMFKIYIFFFSVFLLKSIYRTEMDWIRNIFFFPLDLTFPTLDFSEIVLRKPLWNLFWRGPKLFGSSFFWEGQNDSDICSQLTNVAASHWDKNADTCNELKEAHFDMFYTSFITVLYFYLLWIALSTALQCASVFLSTSITRLLFSSRKKEQEK